MARLEGLEQQTIDNEYYRQVIATGQHAQIVIMSIPAGSDIGEEIHPDNDQILYFIAGHGKTILDDQEQPFEAGDAVLVPAGTKHNFLAASDQDLKILTVYAPPHHPDRLIQETKAQANAETMSTVV